jgi:hypothetical protein
VTNVSTVVDLGTDTDRWALGIDESTDTLYMTRRSSGNVQSIVNASTTTSSSTPNLFDIGAQAWGIFALNPGIIDTANDTATVTILDNDTPPVITSDGGGDTATAMVPENTTAVTDVNATDAEGDTENGGGLTYAITGGADASLFSIDTNTGVLTFDAAPDFENPGNADTDNNYEVTVTVTDSGNPTPLSDSQAITVTVTNVNEAPTISAPAAVSIAENTTAVADVDSSDPDGETEGGGGLSYSLGGADAGAFTIDANGNLAFAVAPDFEAPADAGGNNVYDVTVTVTDGDGLTDSADVAVTVNNITATIGGTVFVDVDGDGSFDGGTEIGIDGVTVTLTGDSLATPLVDVTSAGGLYAFTVDDEFGTYRIVETQPTGVDDGAEIAGSGAVSYTLNPDDGEGPLNDVIELTLGADADDSGQPDDATGWDFTEVGQAIQAGDTATIGFWRNKNGQRLIDQLDETGELTAWLEENFDNIFDSGELASHGGVGEFYKTMFFKKKLKGTPKVDAQFMAVALATFATSSNLSNGSASDYGFTVTETGIGTKVVNVGDGGEAFGVDDNSDMTIMTLLLATNRYTGTGADLVYDGAQDTDDDGIADANGGSRGSLEDYEKLLRVLANEVYTAINEDGDI